MSNWWDGRALSQSTHARINASNYPGTRQLCTLCECPTGRCKEDEMVIEDVGPVCEDCYANENPYLGIKP